MVGWTVASFALTLCAMCINPGVYCTEQDCFDNTTCTANNATCACPEERKRQFCSQITCDRDCLNGGVCQGGMCRCPFGFRGEYCEDSKVCTDPWCQLCRNGSCACPSNATWCRPSSGRKQLQCHPSCLNGGFCHEGKCRCPYGFKGDHCQIPPGQRCGEGHCYHTTACNKTSGTCVCPPQLTGPYCNISTCYPMCQNNGTCVKTGDSPYCTCKPGFGGRHCEHNLTECGHSYCYNGGECVSGRCVCRPEYTGLHCKIPQCNATCQNGGTCQFSHCQCPQGYGGLYCEQEYTYCRGLMCGNNGYCIRDRCVCLPGFTGPTCETEMCSRVCPYYGRCLHQKCYCPNYTSSEDACDQYYTKCGDTPCLNNGTCDGSSCVCARGYTGVYCEVEICNIDCLNGATCHRDSCVCAKGWKGDRCQIRAGIATRPKQKDKTLFRVQYCPVEVETGEKGTFEWPQTQARGVARLPCPCAMNPSLTKGIFAWRKCSSRGVWRDADWTACSRSTRIQRLCSVSKRELLNAVKNVSSEVSALGTGDVALLASAVDELSSTDENVNDEETRDELLNVVNDILSVDKEVLEETSQTSDTSDKIVDVLDKIAAKVILSGRRMRVRKAKFLLEVEETKIDDIPSEGFTPDLSADTRNRARLPKSLFRSLNVNASENLRISSSVIDNPSLFKGRYESVSVSSSIISISVVGRSVAGLDTPIELTFDKMNATSLPDWRTECQFWNESLDDGLGAWSGEGCSVLEETEEEVKCACNHLTSFATVQVQSGSLCISCLVFGAVVLAVPIALSGLCVTGVMLGVAAAIIKRKLLHNRLSVNSQPTPRPLVISNEYASSSI